jgi:hypothetical protein
LFEHKGARPMPPDAELDEGNTMNIRSMLGLLALTTGALAAPAQAQNYNITISGEITPGVYGRIDLGNRQPPPVVYAQPVLIRPVPVGVIAPAPMYVYAPPGHIKKWGKHCHRYNACGVPVYFVRVDEKRGKGKGHGRDHGRWDDDQGRGRGRD